MIRETARTMANPQQLRYRDVEDLIAQLPRDERELLLMLRELIFYSLPAVREKLSYNVPFYFLKKRLAFLWPASVPWGNLSKGVALGFCQGAAFQDQQFFEKSEHRQIRRILFRHPSEVDPSVLRMLLHEASAIDH